MKHDYKYAALAAAMMLTWGTASAQDATLTARSDDFSRSLSYEDYLKGKDLRTSELVGARVRNPAGDNLGEIEEIVIPTGDQDDMLVIVSVGGVLDVGDKLVALPYDDLRVSLDGDTFYFDRTDVERGGVVLVLGGAVEDDLKIRLILGDLFPALGGDGLIELGEHAALREVVAPGRAELDRVGLDRREVERLVEVDFHILRDGEGGDHEEPTGERCA